MHRWHYDLKPSNILVVSNGCEERYKWQFKIADLGISHFIRNSPQQDDFRAGDTNGTMTYGSFFDANF
jgi:serine/threonine protein kinase